MHLTIYGIHTIKNFSPCVVDNIFHLCYVLDALLLQYTQTFQRLAILRMITYDVLYSILVEHSAFADSPVQFLLWLLHEFANTVYVLGLGYHNSPFAVVMETNSRRQDHTCYHLDSPSHSCFWFCSKFLGLLWWVLSVDSWVPGCTRTSLSTLDSSPNSGRPTDCGSTFTYSATPHNLM